MTGLLLLIALFAALLALVALASRQPPAATPCPPEPARGVEGLFSCRSPR